MKPATRRALKGVLLAVAGLLIGIGIAGYYLMQRTLPPTNGVVVLNKLRHDVSITFDEMGIPQIWAENDKDAIFALGYQHAADRMFQMDLIRRLSQGRLSEMLGSVTLETDRRQRMIGHTRIANEAIDNLANTNRELLQAYADGVNSYYVTCGSVPFEYKLLPVDFEPWTVYDCLTVLSFQTWFSDALQNRDRFYLELLNKVTPERARELVGAYPDWAPSTVPDDLKQSSLPPLPKQQFAHRSTKESVEPPPHCCVGSWTRRRRGCDPTPNCLSNKGGGSHEFAFVRRGGQDPPQRTVGSFSASTNILASAGPRTTSQIPSSSTPFQQAVAASLLDGAKPTLTMSAASNSWVLSPDKSASGYAMLAADPHLEIGRLPQFWYVVGMHVESSSSGVLGVTVPGLPFIVMGHNGAAAWSFTAGGVDITDYYEEKSADDDSLSILTPTGVEPLEVIVDTIYATDALPLVFSTKLTSHGPIMIEEGGRLFSLKWAGYDVDMNAAVTSGFALHRVQSFDQFRAVVTKLGALNANYMYADREGNIGYQLATPVPIRSRGGGTFPYKGWIETDNGQQGYLPLEKTPHVFNPSQGYLASCNNQPSWSHDVPGNYAADRILRASHLLKSSDVVSAEDMGAWQLDQHDLYLRRWQSVLAEALEAIGELVPAIEVRKWDGQTSDESVVTPLMVLFLSHLKKLTYQDELGEMHSQVSKLTLDRMYHSDDHSWFDDVYTKDIVETRDQIAQQAARTAVEIVYGSDTDRDLLPPKRWGEMHTLTMRHPMAIVPVLGSLLDLRRGPWSWSGSPGSLNSSFYSKANDTTFSCIVGPSWRFVIDFADVDAATMVLPAGNSGNPISPHFFDFNQMWRDGQRWTVPFSRDKVFARAVSTLTLQPGTLP